MSFLDIKHLKVWTSTLQRTISTAVCITATERKKFSSLDEINAGNFDGLSYDDIAELYPEEFEKRQQDKLGYRYPGGNKYNSFAQAAHQTPIRNLLYGALHALSLIFV